MNSVLIHKKILSLYRKCPDNLKKLLEDDAVLTKHSDDDVLRLLFKNFRSTKKGTQGLRLTSIGHNFISKHYEHFIYQVDCVPLLGTRFLLDKYQIWPYYISRNYAVFYNDMDASMFKLCNNDINQYAETLNNG